MSHKNTVYRIIFVQNDNMVEIYAKQVGDADNLFGFVIVEDFLFGEKSTVVVDPSEERLKAVFQGVKRTFIPVQEIVRIDEVEKQGTGKIMPLEGGSSLSTIPFPLSESSK